MGLTRKTEHDVSLVEKIETTAFIFILIMGVFRLSVSSQVSPSYQFFRNFQVYCLDKILLSICFTYSLVLLSFY